MTSDTTLRDAALSYALAGFKVFPLIPGGKTPAIKEWKDLASSDPATVMAWWAKDPRFNIAIKTGGDLVVLDIDVKGDKDGWKALGDKDVSGGFRVTTPSGGTHIYWRTSAPFRNGVDVYGMKGVDIRAGGGYICAPVSRIGDKTYHTDDDVKNIGPVPQWLVDAEAKRNAPPVAGEITPADYDEDVIKRARAYMRQFAPAIAGQSGHIQTLKAASALVVGFCLTDEDALSILIDEFNPRCVPMWTERELRHKVTEARTKPIRERGYLLNRIQSRTDKAPITNFTTRTVLIKGKEVEIPEPKTLNAICDEIKDRFGDYPRRLGERLFDFDPTLEKPETIQNPAAFSAWLQREGEAIVNFKPSPGFPKIAEVFESFLSTAKRYDAVSAAPFFPPRQDVFDLCGELPPPEEDGRAFWELINRFSLNSPEDRLLTACFFCAPLIYSPLQDFDRPLWVIDSADAQGSGKTSVAEVCAALYACTPICLDFTTLDRQQDAAKKRIISSEGRASRFVLFDNVVGDIKSPTLAQLITSKTISERAAYGRGEESRPNDLTYCLTVNGGAFDADLASRSYTIRVKRPEIMVPFWKRKTLLLAMENRKQILSDIVHMLKGAGDKQKKDGGKLWERDGSRFKEFDAIVMAAVCKDREEFDRLADHITRTTLAANLDVETAETFQCVLERKLAEATESGWKSDLPTVVFADDISTHVLTEPELRGKNLRAKDVAQWIKGGLLPNFSREFRKLNNGDDFRKAFLFGVDKFGPGLSTVQVVKFAVQFGASKPVVSSTIQMRATR